MSEIDDVKSAIEEAATAIGFRLATDAETAELLASIPSLEQQELNRAAQAEASGRILLHEGEEATTAILDALWSEAGAQTPETLTAFMAKLHTDYQHDYGTVCQAVAMAAVGAAWAYDRGPGGGITVFQSGAVMWEFIRHWSGRKGAMRLVSYDDMLYPQYDHKFAKVLDPSTWAYLQNAAAEKLARRHGAPEVRAHWQSIVDGVVPFGYRVAE